MKKIVFLTIVSLMSWTAAEAQKTNYYDAKNELGISIGAGSNTEIFSGIAEFSELTISSVVTTAITGGMATGHYKYGDESYIPTISLEYYRRISKVVALGGFVAFNGLNRDMYVSWANNTNGKRTEEKCGKARRRNFSILPTAKFDWFRKHYFGMYSKVGIGLSIMNETQKDDKDGGTDFSDTSVIPNYQLTLLGMEAGTARLRGFAELGTGEQGILLAGVRVKF